MDTMEITMHAFTSPAARKVDGRVNDEGHIMIALIPWKYMICFVTSAVISDRL